VPSSISYRAARNTRHAELVARREAKAARRAAKRENKHGQFDNAFPAVDGDPIHEGLARTISRGLD
jgi:hypothetical protein